MENKVYAQPDGRIVIRGPKGARPDKETIEHLREAIRREKESKEAVA